MSFLIITNTFQHYLGNWKLVLCLCQLLWLYMSFCNDIFVCKAILCIKCLKTKIILNLSSIFLDFGKLEKC